MREIFYKYLGNITTFIPSNLSGKLYNQMSLKCFLHVIFYANSSKYENLTKTKGLKAELI